MVVCMYLTERGEKASAGSESGKRNERGEGVSGGKERERLEGLELDSDRMGHLRMYAPLGLRAISRWSFEAAGLDSGTAEDASHSDDDDNDGNDENVVVWIRDRVVRCFSGAPATERASSLSGYRPKYPKSTNLFSLCPTSFQTQKISEKKEVNTPLSRISTRPK